MFVPMIRPKNAQHVVCKLFLDYRNGAFFSRETKVCFDVSTNKCLLFSVLSNTPVIQLIDMFPFFVEFC